ncbi:MAG: hypothetical protein FWD28_01235 [Treponema sp.]|nr:hypothetical protein [Treponema sp.]
MKFFNIFSLFAIFSLSFCYGQNIFNDGTAHRMTRDLKVSDFFYDIENIYQYDGRNQEFRVKIKSFFWQDENNENFTIESAFFIVKSFATGGGFDYSFQYRRYIILSNEESRSDNIRNIWLNSGTEINRGSTLYLSDSSDDRIPLGWWHTTAWSCIDGLYERHNYSMYFERTYGPIIDQLLNEAVLFTFYFPSQNLETNGLNLELSELERIKKNGIFPELTNNSFSLSADELENLKDQLAVLINQEKMDPKEYIERMRGERL